MSNDAKGRYKLNVRFNIIPESLTPQFLKDFPNYYSGVAVSSPGGYFTSPEFAKYAEDFYNLKPRPDDVYVLTYPKCGTTWMQELVWLVLNDCDFEGSKLSLSIRAPFME